jgi:hypothetical protein
VEAIMPRSISKFVIVTVAIGVAIVGASAIGIAAAHSSHEQAKATTHRHGDGSEDRVSHR